jgi:hypothetical protein
LPCSTELLFTTETLELLREVEPPPLVVQHRQNRLQ